MSQMIAQRQLREIVLDRVALATFDHVVDDFLGHLGHAVRERLYHLGGEAPETMRRSLACRDRPSEIIDWSRTRRQVRGGAVSLAENERGGGYGCVEDVVQPGQRRSSRDRAATSRTPARQRRQPGWGAQLVERCVPVFDRLVPRIRRHRKGRSWSCVRPPTPKVKVYALVFRDARADPAGCARTRQVLLSDYRSGRRACASSRLRAVTHF